MTEQSVSSDAQPATPATVIEAGEKLTPAAVARKMSTASKPATKPATKRNTKRATKPAQRDKPAQRTQRTQRDKPAQRNDDSMSESQLKRYVYDALVTAHADFAMRLKLPAGVKRDDVVRIVAARASYIPGDKWDARLSPATVLVAGKRSKAARESAAEAAKNARAAKRAERKSRASAA